MNELVIQTQISTIVGSLKTLETELVQLMNMKKEIDLQVSNHKKAIDTTKASIKSSMVNNDVSNVKTSTFQVSLKSSGKKVKINDETAIPNDYFKVVREVDTALLKAVLNTGKEIPGAELIASEPALTIKYSNSVGK